MYQRKITISLGLVSLLGLAVSSFSYTQMSAVAYVLASWLRPFATIGFLSGLGLTYADIIKRSNARSIILSLAISTSFFVLSFFISSILFRNAAFLFPGVHSYIFIPSVIAALIMLLVSIYARPVMQPLSSRIESVAMALLPMFLVVMMSVIVSLTAAGHPQMKWLSRDYLSKPAVMFSPGSNEAEDIDNVIYTGPLKVSYNMTFIQLYKDITGPEGARVTDFGNFAGYHMFVASKGHESSLIVYDNTGNPVKNIRRIDNIYHSDSMLAAVSSEESRVYMFDISLKKLYEVNYPQTVMIRKIVFSEDLFAVLYSRLNEELGMPDSFSVIYRSDTGDRAGRIEAEDIAARLKSPGFLVVKNEPDGLYLTVLDRNSNKRSYLFKAGKLENARTVQCGSDRFFVRADHTDKKGIKRQYSLLYDISRYRKLHESVRRPEESDLGPDMIIAVTGGYYLTDSMRLLDSALDQVMSYKEPSGLPFRMLPPSGNDPAMETEGAISSIDLSPTLEAFIATPDLKTILADMKGTLIIKKIMKFMDYFVVMTNNRIFIYNDDLDIIERIELPQSGYISKARIENEAILLTFDTEDDITIYAIGPDLRNRRIALINTRQGKIWDLSDEFIVYGYGFRPSPDPSNPGTPSVLVAKGIVTDDIYERMIVPPLHSYPSIEKDRLFFPFRDFSEVVDLQTGKRSVIDSAVIKANDMRYGITDSGLVIDLITLKTMPISLDRWKVGSSPVSRGKWIDLHGYLIAPGDNLALEVIRPGLSTLGDGSICSSTDAKDGMIVNCLNLSTALISASFYLAHDYDIVYSDPDMVFLKDNHSLIALRTEGGY